MTAQSHTLSWPALCGADVMKRCKPRIHCHLVSRLYSDKHDKADKIQCSFFIYLDIDYKIRPYHICNWKNTGWNTIKQTY